jgi:monoamine oxidase
MGAASMLHLSWSQRVSPQNETPERYLFDGGAAQLPLKLAEQVGGRNVRLNEPVHRIARSASGVVVSTAKRRYRAKAAVVAMPPHLTARIQHDPPLPAARDQLTQRAPMGAIIKAFAVYARPWWKDLDLSGLAIGNLDAIELVADSTNMAVPGAPGAWLFVCLFV